MKRLTIPCLASFIAMLAFVGASQAATNTIDELFDITLETRAMITTVDADLEEIGTQTAILHRHVDQLYASFKTGGDPDVIRWKLDKLNEFTAATKARFSECRTELRVCDRTLEAVRIEAEQWAAKGHFQAPKLLRLIKLCEDEMYVAQSRTGECMNAIRRLRESIDGLYALLP